MEKKVKTPDIPFEFDNMDKVTMSNTYHHPMPKSTIEVSGGLYKINSGKWKTRKGKVNPGDIVKVKSEISKNKTIVKDTK